MDFNPVNFFVFPGRTIKSAGEKPSFGTALFFVVLPSVITLLAFLSISLGIDWAWLAAYTIKNYLGWIFISAAVYFFGFLAAGKAMKGKFSAIYSSLAMMWLLIALVILLMFFASFAFAPKLFGIARVAKDARLDSLETTEFLNLVASRDTGALGAFAAEHNIKTDISKLVPAEGEELLGGGLGMIVVAAIALVLLFYMLFVYPFLTIRAATNSGILKSIVLYICSMIVVLFFSLVFSAF
ncbi:MAG: hypothetical protein NT067_07535 [Candidatus Diapherotrites archaeon]|nr:hypothetical protein [Candidatus Diapherotrites archaeon]